MYGANTPPAASTATISSSSATVSASTSAVSVSTAPPSIDDVAGHGFKVGSGGTPKAKLERPIRAIIQKDAADWEPIFLKQGGVPGEGSNSVALRVVKVKGRMKGENTKVKAYARLHKGAKDSHWLVIALHPAALEKRRTTIEIRFRIFEGYVEQVEAVAVTITERRRLLPPKRPRDSFDLHDEGIEYQEEKPGSAGVVVSELDPRPASASSNAGRLEKAEFADKDLGFVNASWSVHGLPK